MRTIFVLSRMVKYERDHLWLSLRVHTSARALVYQYLTAGADAVG